MIKSFILLIFMGTLVTVNESSLCSNRGNSINNTTECKFLEGYITFPKGNIKQCNYEIRSEKIAVFLSLFFGFFGADMFYLGNYFKGFIKLLLPVLLMTLYLLYKNRIHNDKLKLFLMFFPVSLLIFLWMYDIFSINNGKISDIYGISLSK